LFRNPEEGHGSQRAIVPVMMMMNKYEMNEIIAFVRLESLINLDVFSMQAQQEGMLDFSANSLLNAL
jgi:hypothetical protein